MKKISFLLLIIIVLVLSSCLHVENESNKEGENVIDPGNNVVLDKDIEIESGRDDFHKPGKEEMPELVVVDTSEVLISGSSFYSYGYMGGENGSITIANHGTFSLDPSKFKLYLNKELQENDGCELPGKLVELEPRYKCKLYFYQSCDDVDVLEVTYNDEKVYMEFC